MIYHILIESTAVIIGAAINVFAGKDVKSQSGDCFELRVSLTLFDSYFIIDDIAMLVRQITILVAVVLLNMMR